MSTGLTLKIDMAIVMLSGSYMCMCDVGIVEPRWNETISYIGIFSNDLLFLFSVAIIVPVEYRHHRLHLLTKQQRTVNKRADKKNFSYLQANARERWNSFRQILGYRDSCRAAVRRSTFLECFPSLAVSSPLWISSSDRVPLCLRRIRCCVSNSHPVT